MLRTSRSVTNLSATRGGQRPDSDAAARVRKSRIERQVRNRFVQIVGEQQGWSHTKALNFVRNHASYASPLPRRNHVVTVPRAREHRRSHPGRRQGSRRGQSRGDPDPPGDESESDSLSGGRR
jgi:hypothetical protein